MEQQFFTHLLDYDVLFSNILLCIAVFYMHRKTEKIETKKDNLTSDLVSLHSKTIDVLDRLTDTLDNINIISYEKFNKRD